MSINYENSKLEKNGRKESKVVYFIIIIIIIFEK